MKLTPEQVATLQRIPEENQRAAELQAALISARNFSACAHGEPTCDQAALTPVQIQTLRQIVQETLNRGTSAAQTDTPSPSGGFDPQYDGDRQASASVLATPPAFIPPERSSRSREAWKSFGRGLLNVLGAAAQAYVEVQSQKAQARPVIVSGGGTIVIGDAMVMTATPSIVESQIDGAFTGWSGETIFKLTNGQIWQQSAYAYHYHYAYRPKVYIYQSAGRFQMQVEGVQPSIVVTRLR